jgi:hypothetical protein
MWEWLSQHDTAVSALANVCMVVIWLVYLQLFYMSFRRQRRPCLLIHHAQGYDPSDLCLLVNMGSEAVHVHGVLARIEVEGRSLSQPITELGEVSARDENMEASLRQGPLHPGDYLVLGSVEQILDFSKISPGKEIQEAQDRSSMARIDCSVEICVVAAHGPSCHLVGACQKFLVREVRGRWILRPESLLTEQYTSRHSRTLVEGWMKEYVRFSTSPD